MAGAANDLVPAQDAQEYARFSCLPLAHAAMPLVSLKLAERADMLFFSGGNLLSFYTRSTAITNFKILPLIRCTEEIACIIYSNIEL